MQGSVATCSKPTSLTALTRSNDVGSPRGRSGFTARPTPSADRIGEFALPIVHLSEF